MLYRVATMRSEEYSKKRSTSWTKTTSGRILMIVENHYPNDIRVRKEAETLSHAGYSVAVVALKGKGQRPYKEINDVNIYRVPEIILFKKTTRNSSYFIIQLFKKLCSMTGYILEYAYFTVVSFFVSFYIYLKHGFDVVHTHNPPDTLSIIGIFYRMLGKKYVYDHHDLSPELYLARVSGKKGLLYRGLIFFEKFSCRFSDIVISTNESYKRIEMSRHSIYSEKIYVVRNNPIMNDCNFADDESKHIRSDNHRTTVLFLGSINPQDGVDILLKAIHYLVYTLKEKSFICNIVGGGDSLDSAKRLAVELELTGYVDFKGPIYDREKVKGFLSSADIGVEPAPRNEANEHSTFIKVMEFMAAGIPLVAFDLKETRYSADGAAVLVSPGDIEGFGLALKQLIGDPSKRLKMGKAGLLRIESELNWKNASSNLIKAYNALSLHSIQ